MDKKILSLGRQPRLSGHLPGEWWHHLSKSSRCSIFLHTERSTGEMQGRCSETAVISNNTFLGRLVWAEKQPSFLKDEYWAYESYATRFKFISVKRRFSAPVTVQWPLAMHMKTSCLSLFCLATDMGREIYSLWKQGLSDRSDSSSWQSRCVLCQRERKIKV